MLPRQGVVNVAFEGIGTIRRQDSVVRFAVRSKIVERLVESASCIRRVAPYDAPVGLVSRSQAGIVAPQAAPRVAEHPSPAMASTFRETQFDSIVIADCLWNRWASRA